MPWKPAKVSSTARGYGKAHKRLREQWAPLVAAGGVNCWRCGRQILPGTKWHLGHHDWNRSIYQGPEHAQCNLSGAAKKANRIQKFGKPRAVVDRW